MTSHARSHLEYLIPINNILVFLLHSKSSLIDEFSIRLSDYSEVAYFLLGYNIPRVHYIACVGLYPQAVLGPIVKHTIYILLPIVRNLHYL